MSEKGASPQASPLGLSSKQETVIGPGVHITGDLKGAANVELKGSVAGNVDLDGQFVVGKGGKLTGDISATKVFVEGEVIGNIHAKDSVRLSSTSKIVGNVKADALSIQEGALFKGRVDGYQHYQPSRPVEEMEESPVYQ